VDKINPADYSENIKNSKIFLEGKSQELISKFADLMETASNNQSYEQAAILRDRIKKLQTVAAQQYVSSNKKQHKSTDVIACIISSNTLIMAILQFRHGSLLGSKEYTDKISLEYNNNVVLEEIYLSVLSQFYLNLPESTGCPVELVLNFDLSHDNQQLLNNIINNNFRNLHNLDIITNPRGSKLRWLNLAEQNAKELFEKNRKKAAIYEHQFLLLKQELNLSKIPNRIECFDVSHTFGQHVIASCIVFNSSGPDKASYRRYNINLNKNSDTGSISEVLIRRYKKMLSAGSENMETMPEFILIDGGKGQVNAAKKVIADLTETPELTNIKIYGITKGEGRRAEYDRILSGESMEYLQISFKSEAMHLLQQIRNEAHRFAIVGHRAKRSKEQTHSLLEDLPGVGARRRRNLLMHLGGWQEVLSATVEQLAMVPGISKAKAKIIYEYLHDPNSSSKYIK
ncbi:MAG: excinuclease ABC subunit C, partial [Gammaproteobacteria bacterium]|nr:excinuclease ABC subunit C [Gammaproteobacteria bacterium]